jgi:outer membrane protein assembly factor BamB
MPRRLSLVIGLAVASAVWADTWPQWRGPNRDAVSTEKGLLDRWEEAPPLVWKAHGLGSGYAGAVVGDGLVCTMGERDGKMTVIAVSDKDGKEIWATEINETDVDATTSGYSSPQSTPTMDGERVYALSPGGHLVCLQTTTGERLWEKSYKRDFGSRRPYFSYSESPLVDGDKLICSPGGAEAGVVALDKKTGAERWRCALSFQPKNSFGSCYASMVLSHGAGVKQYVQFMAEGVVGIEAETGKELWRYSGTSGLSNICTPIVRGDYVYIPCGYYAGSALLKLMPKGDGVEAKEVYFVGINKLRTDSGGAVLVGDYLYASDVSSGSPQCIEFSTGKMMWPRKRSPGSGAAAVVYADGHVYFRYENGVMLLVAATPGKYQLKGQFQTPGNERECWAHPAISNGRLYLRNDDTIYCYDLRKK